MRFTDALSYLYNNRTNDREFCDPFLLYCRMSDLCGQGYENKRKVELFYQVNKRLGLVKSVLTKDNSVESRYKEVADLLSLSSFQKLIETVGCAVFPEYKRKTAPPPLAAPRVAVQAVAVRQAESEEEEPRTPLTSGYTGGMGRGGVALSIILGVLLPIGLFITLGCIFKWSWTFWQWPIGIFGGLLITAILFGIVVWFDNELFIDYYVLGTVLLGVCTAVNLILLIAYKGNYKIISGLLSGYGLFTGTVLAFNTFGEYETVWGWINIAEIIAAIVTVVTSIIWI